MSFKSITVMLLLSCLGATSTALGGKKEPPQNVPQPLTITDVRWLWTEALTTVQICTMEDLSVGQPLFVFDDGTHGVVNVEGLVDAVTPTCANFSREGPHKPIEDSSRYELLLEDTNNLGSFLGRGVTIFAITMSTTLLTCGGSHITKITWTSESEMFDEEFCLDGSLDLVKACYHEGNLMGTEFCFVVNDGANNLNVCLNGPTDSTPPFDGGVTANYFYYGDDVVNNVEAPDATLSLLMDTNDQTKLRAIVRSAGDIPGVANIYDCSSPECLITSYTPTVATYEVCVEAMDDSLVTLRTATTTFTDMNLHAFDGGSTTSILVEFVFAKALADHLYTAILYMDSPLTTFPDGSGLSTTALDCTGVQPGHACFGLLYADGGGTIVYVALSFSDGTNTIIVPYNTNPSPEPRIDYQ